jgi:hypothetical protein
LNSPPFPLLSFGDFRYCLEREKYKKNKIKEGNKEVYGAKCLAF